MLRCMNWAALGAALVTTTITAKADTIVYDNAGPITSTNKYDTTASPPLLVGLGERLSVSQDTIISGIDFEAAFPLGGNVHFVIFDAGSALPLQLVFSTSPYAIAADASYSYAASGPILFTLLARHTYDIGIETDSRIIAPYHSGSVTEGGIADHGGTFFGGAGGTVDFGTVISSNFNIRLEGPSAAPAPSALVMSSTLFAILGGLAVFQRCRRRVIRYAI